ncbi:MAG TPA: hypothetical protein GX706_02105 [Candidatus Moranbacteria bacterium]|nr:hypothetical protein [Candidatus Moranbacteria bacterium]
MKKNYEIIVYGRGGQGGKTTAELITQAAALKEKYVQSFPEFGPERSGAPVRAFVRIAEEPIKTHQSVQEADCILVLDETLLETDKLKSDLSDYFLERGVMVVNSKKTKQEIKSKFSGKLEVIVVDATGLAEKIVGESRPNVVILGKFAQTTKIVDAEDIMTVFRSKYLPKIGEDKTEKNIEAIRQSALSEEV